VEEPVVECSNAVEVEEWRYEQQSSYSEGSSEVQLYSHCCYGKYLTMYPSNDSAVPVGHKD
jgi:hypothetical protein